MDFAERVCELFPIGDGRPVRIAPHPGSGNRLWTVRSDLGRFVVKEFPYDGEERAGTLRHAAEFECAVWRSGRVPMPDPVRARDGGLIQWTVGSRGARVMVRVHHWMDGTPVPRPTATETVRAAGTALAVIQELGAAFASLPCAGLHWWSVDPVAVLVRLVRAGLIPGSRAAAEQAVLHSASALIAQAEALPGSCGFTHCDHKPENSLQVGAGVAVLDWDECGPCHPRVEAVESALRWAGGDRGEPAPELFRAFLDGYQALAGPLGPLAPVDFAKWVAAQAGWFSFMGQRALHDFDDTDAEAAEAAREATEALRGLAACLAALDRWAAALGTPGPHGAPHGPSGGR